MDGEQLQLADPSLETSACDEPASAQQSADVLTPGASAAVKPAHKCKTDIHKRQRESSARFVAQLRKHCSTYSRAAYEECYAELPRKLSIVSAETTAYALITAPDGSFTEFRQGGFAHEGDGKALCDHFREQWMRREQLDTVARNAPPPVGPPPVRAGTAPAAATVAALGSSKRRAMDKPQQSAPSTILTDIARKCWGYAKGRLSKQLQKALHSVTCGGGVIGSRSQWVHWHVVNGACLCGDNCKPLRAELKDYPGDEPLPDWSRADVTPNSQLSKMLISWFLITSFLETGEAAKFLAGLQNTLRCPWLLQQLPPELLPPAPESSAADETASDAQLQGASDTASPPPAVAGASSQPPAPAVEPFDELLASEQASEAAALRAMEQQQQQQPAIQGMVLPTASLAAVAAVRGVAHSAMGAVVPPTAAAAAMAARLAVPHAYGAVPLQLMPAQLMSAALQPGGGQLGQLTALLSQQPLEHRQLLISSLQQPQLAVELPQSHQSSMTTAVRASGLLSGNVEVAASAPTGVRVQKRASMKCPLRATPEQQQQQPQLQLQRQQQQQQPQQQRKRLEVSLPADRERSKRSKGSSNANTSGSGPKIGVDGGQEEVEPPPPPPPPPPPMEKQQQQCESSEVTLPPPWTREKLRVLENWEFVGGITKLLVPDCLTRVLLHVGVNKADSEQDRWLSTGGLDVVVATSLPSNRDSLLAPSTLFASIAKGPEAGVYACGRMLFGSKRASGASLRTLFKPVHRSIFHYKQLLIMINDSNYHFLLAEVILNQDAPRVSGAHVTCIFYDSLYSSGRPYEAYARSFAQWVQAEFVACKGVGPTARANREISMPSWASKYKDEPGMTWRLAAGYPQQGNGWECGSRTLTAARCRIRGEDIDPAHFSKQLEAEKALLLQATLQHLDDCLEPAPRAAMTHG